MSNEQIKRIQALSRGDPSLSEILGKHLAELCGGPVEFFAIILAENDAKKVLVTTAAKLDSDHAGDALMYLADALTIHASGNAPPDAMAYSHIKKVEE